MSKLTEKSRKLLRKIYMILGAGAISLLFQACYGVPMDEVSGQVRCKETDNPIPNIKVSIQNDNVSTQTEEDGSFSLYFFGDRKNTVIFEDIDGYDNGGLFKTKYTEVKRNTYLDIYLTKEEEGEE